MNRNLYLGLMWLVASFTLCAQAKTSVYKMPQTLVQQLKLETEQRRKNDCEQQKLELFSSNFYALNNDKLFILMGLPDNQCHASSFMPITIDRQGRWEFGAVLESYPSLLLTDATHQLWLVSHFEHEAVFPLLHHSVDGVHWQEISLPKRNIDCCFEWLKQVCITAPQIQLKFTGMDDTPIEYWSTTIDDSLKTAPNWQKLTHHPEKNAKQCQTSPLTNGDWQRKTSADGKEIWFQSATHSIKIIVPHWLND